jgi:hypothetical protein
MTPLGPERKNDPPMTRERRRFRVAGVVQGLGFRPFVYGLAGGTGSAASC